MTIPEYPIRGAFDNNFHLLPIVPINDRFDEQLQGLVSVYGGDATIPARYETESPATLKNLFDANVKKLNKIEGNSVLVSAGGVDVDAWLEDSSLFIHFSKEGVQESTIFGYMPVGYVVKWSAIRKTIREDSFTIENRQGVEYDLAEPLAYYSIVALKSLGRLLA